MNQALVALVVLGFLAIHHESSAQPLCSDQITTTLCLRILEEMIQRNQPFDPKYLEEPPLHRRVPPELFDNNLSLVDRGTKRQDVDHVFLRFGR